MLIPPYGGVLVDRVAGPEEAATWREKTPELPRLPLRPYELSDLVLIATGAYSPLEGFMNRADYQGVLRHMRLSRGLPWGLPVTLAVDTGEAARLREGQAIALSNGDGQAVGILHLEEKYTYSREEEARLVFRTTDTAHPGVARLYERGEVLLGGKLTLLGRPADSLWDGLPAYPAQSRRLFQEKGWHTVVGFQTRNPVHRAHEYIQKCALEVVDGLFLHPLVGDTKADDIPAEVRLACYRVLLAEYYPQQRVVLGVLPAAMRYAGPREAIFHALVRQNYGCSHFIVGRDHAGVGNYYGPYDAQAIFNEFAPGELQVTPLFFDNAFFCRRCGAMATAKTCPHDQSGWVTLSGTRVRHLLQEGEELPPEFTRPEVAEVLRVWVARSAQ